MEIASLMSRALCTCLGWRTVDRRTCARGIRPEASKACAWLLLIVGVALAEAPENRHC